ncbi:MAG: hypothetical protein H0V76_09080 [Blastocatellia bacterium]|nr:hypothetical protein [Blastocatellia bacterium]
MNFYRETIKNLPPVINMPAEFRNRNAEIIILPLDESNGNQAEDDIERDAMGYPIGFFEETAGSLADDPVERAPQGGIRRTGGTEIACH